VLQTEDQEGPHTRTDGPVMLLTKPVVREDASAAADAIMFALCFVAGLHFSSHLLSFRGSLVFSRNHQSFCMMDDACCFVTMSVFNQPDPEKE
jgi:hypothetical protein